MSVDKNSLIYMPEGFLDNVEASEHLKYSDTDSCGGNSQIQINNDILTMKNFYEDSCGEEECIGKDNFVKKLSKEYISPSVSKDLKIEHKKVKYVMKHKVKKRMFKVTIGDDSVVITADHSLIVYRNNVLTEIKPKEVKENDRLFKIRRKTKMY